MNEKILIIGKRGQLGEAVQQRFTAQNVDFIAVGRDTLDVAQPEQIRQVVQEIKPQRIINCAAYTAVDKAESEPELAKRVNGTAPGILAQEAAKIGAFLVHFSTDYVFDGQKNIPYTEEDQPKPLSVYGRTKRQGEEEVLGNCDRALILRTSWVYGNGQTGNFVKTMLRLGKEREELRVVYDQIGAPTWTQDLADLLGYIPPDLTGLYHYSNSGVASWYDFAVEIFTEAQKLGFPLKIQQVVPILTPEYPTPAQRPQYSLLSSAALLKPLNLIAPHWRKSLQKMLRSMG